MICFVRSVSGESMENALRACCKGIKIGKILIHRDGDNGMQVYLFLSTPFTIYKDHVSFVKLRNL